MNDFELFTYSVYNALGVGHQNAQTRRELCHKLHCGDRSLRRAIEALRRNYAILSKDDGKGYYLPETSEAGRDEARQWLKRQNDRMHSIKASQAGAAKFAGQYRRQRQNETPGQLNMFGVGRSL